MNEYCDNAEALAVARRFADWVKTRMDELSDIQMQAMLGNEYRARNPRSVEQPKVPPPPASS